jgi:hypothetical protein
VTYFPTDWTTTGPVGVADAELLGTFEDDVEVFDALLIDVFVVEETLLLVELDVGLVEEEDFVEDSVEEVETLLVELDVAFVDEEDFVEEVESFVLVLDFVEDVKETLTVDVVDVDFLELVLADADEMTTEDTVAVEPV